MDPEYARQCTVSCDNLPPEAQEEAGLRLMFAHVGEIL